MNLPDKRLTEIVRELASRPKHEKVRTLVYTLLTEGLGAESQAIDFEKSIPEARGRIDALLGCTVFEFKSDLRREKNDSEEELGRYLPEREKAAKAKFIGIATDGADWTAYEIRDGMLCELNSYRTSVESGRELLAWLDGAVALASDLPAEPISIIYELGRESVAWLRSHGQLTALWEKLKGRPGVSLKRQIWSQMLTHVYGKSIDEDELWFQHTYLTFIAKTIAVRALGLPIGKAQDLLSGRSFRDFGVFGAVESDFFDWPLEEPAGAALVEALARQVARFKLEDVETDVLKVLYESLIDPAQRHDLGEYYTPDWLASRICERAITDPLNQVVLDPACGSGSFLFHAVRRNVAAASESGMRAEDIASNVASNIAGIDIHPVAVIIARVTYLLALGDYLRNRKGDVSIPVYLGDALQWNVKDMMGMREVVVTVPPVKPSASPTSLRFPGGLCEEPAKFDHAIDTLLRESEAKAKPAAVKAALKRHADVAEEDLDDLEGTYRELRKLHEAGRDHIWGYVARNLSRPVWLSKMGHKADVLVGNPPWLSLRYMDAEMQKRTRDAMKLLDIWVGGKVATHQDLSALFFARAAELYLEPGGTIAFVMPMAALTREQFRKFRTGRFRGAFAEFTEAWTFDEHVQPLFPVPSSVLFAVRAETAKAVPDEVRAFQGNLPYRDAPPEIAAQHLNEAISEKPSDVSFAEMSPYRNAFRQGATLVPRMLCLVEPVPGGRLGATSSAPLVRSRRSKQEKTPWKDLESLQGQIESEFLYPVYLGESITPYRILGSFMGVIPFEEETLTASGASGKGHSYLAAWLTKAEELWEKNGAGRIKFQERINYFHLLDVQFPIEPLRVVYSKAGTLAAATLLEDAAGIVDRKLYWMRVDSREEGLYLCAIINSETARERVAHLQSRGQWGARDFDKVLFTLPIPRFDAKNEVHKKLAEAAAKAEEIARSVPLKPGVYFTTARKAVRSALEEEGISTTIDSLVERLLD